MEAKAAVFGHYPVAFFSGFQWIFVLFYFTVKPVTLDHLKGSEKVQGSLKLQGGLLPRVQFQDKVIPTGVLLLMSFVS